MSSCNKTAMNYLRLMMQLLPHGLAWQWGERSAGRHLLAAIAVEFQRVHAFFCAIATYSIERFSDDNYGWSFADYERLLLNKFNVVATVSDHACDPLNVDSSMVDSLVYGHDFVYLIEITVDDLAVITPEIKAYLEEYKQSHTVFCYRDRQLAHSVAWDTDALTVDNAAAGSELYHEDYHRIHVSAHESWPTHELNQLSSWDNVANMLKNHSQVERIYA